jgi:hypothetical protein
MSDGGGSGLDAVDIFFIVLLLLYPGLCALGVLIIICKKVCGFCLSICSKACGFCFSIFDKWSLSRNNSHRSSASRAPHVPSVPNVPDGPSETKPDRSEGDPRVCDVCITPWHPLCPQPDPQSGKLRLSRKRNANHTANAQKRARWGRFFVSRIHSAHPFRSQYVSCAHFLFLDIQPLSADKVSDADTPISPPRRRGGSSTRHIPWTQIRVCAIVLMPTLPLGRYTELPRDYALGTSYLSCAPE